MYCWNYLVPTGFFYPSVFQPVCPTSSTIPDPYHYLPKANSGIKETEQNQSLALNITAEDLKNAGYVSNKTPWTEEEDQVLKKLRDEKQMEWVEIAEMMPGRNSKMCYSRYRRLENHTKQMWRKADDKLLLELVSIHGDNWKEISKNFSKRTHKQVKEHYINYLRPEIKRDEWTLEEDLKLVEFLNKYGKNWKLIEVEFEGRTQNQIKNRYFGRLKRLAEKKMNLKQKSKVDDKNKTLE